MALWCCFSLAAYTTIRFYSFFPDMIPLDSPRFLYHGSVPVGYQMSIEKSAKRAGL